MPTLPNLQRLLSETHTEPTHRTCIAPDPMSIPGFGLRVVLISAVPVTSQWPLGYVIVPIRHLSACVSATKQSPLSSHWSGVRRHREAMAALTEPNYNPIATVGAVLPYLYKEVKEVNMF